MRRLAVALLLVLPALAGCLQTEGLAPGATTGRDILDPSLREALTEPVYDILGHFANKWDGTTGTQLYVDYYLPDVPDGVLAPVILVMTPYQDPQPGEVVPVLPDDPYNARLVDYFVPRGYAVAFADVRGNHQSGGCIDQTGPEQWQDGYDYVEWLGTQEWSNGKVGMYGASYDGETQFTTAMMQPPHLATIVPVASVSNQYEWNFYNGVPYDLKPLIGMASYFGGSAVPSADPMDLPRYPEKLECQQEQMTVGLDFSGDMTTFWKERDYRPMAKQIQASVLHIHGLQDWNVRPINIDPIFNDIESEKRAIFGQWQHAYPDREDWQSILHAWYDHFLMGKQNGILDVLPPVLLEADDEQWHGLDSFPPLAQEWLTLELSADGKLVTPGTAKAGERVIHDVPSEMLFSVGDNNPAGETATGHPARVAFEWTTTEDLLLVGRPNVTFTATTSEASTHWVAELEVVGKTCDLHGRAMTICDNAGYQDTRHREGLDDPKDLTPGEPYTLTITMYPQADVIKKGSTIHLWLANNNVDIQQDPTNAINTILLGADAPALLHLPLAPATFKLPHEALPTVYPGYVDA